MILLLTKGPFLKQPFFLNLGQFCFKNRAQRYLVRVALTKRPQGALDGIRFVDFKPLLHKIGWPVVFFLVSIFERSKYFLSFAAANI
jgi:hypothetical protein